MADAIVRPALSSDELSEVEPVLDEVQFALSRRQAARLYGHVCSDRDLFLALRRLARRLRNQRTIIEEVV